MIPMLKFVTLLCLSGTGSEIGVLPPLDVVVSPCWRRYVCAQCLRQSDERLKVGCGGCFMAYYCSQDCQVGCVAMPR
jgi:hypothetical protein